MGRLAGWLLRMPGPGSAVPLSVEVAAQGSVIVWRRVFGDHVLSSKQWEEGGLLAESFGPSVLYFEVDAVEGRVEYRSVLVRFLGVRLPRLLAAQTTATVIEEGSGWVVEVEVVSPLIGTLCGYRGRLEIDDE